MSLFRGGKKDIDAGGTLPRKGNLLTPDSASTGGTMKRGGPIGLSASIENLAANKTMQTGRKKQEVAQQMFTDTKKMLKCPMVLLDGTERDFYVPQDALGEVLVNTVLDTIGIVAKDDREYFSITYLIGNGPEKETCWLQGDKKLSEQMSKMSKNTKFDFRVKFYPNEPNRLTDEQTRYQIACQVRMDLITGRLPCSFMSYVILAAYTVQADVGDYDAEPRGVDYVRQMPLAPQAVQTIEFCDRVVELHTALKRFSSAEADTGFLENACKMALYGMHRTKVLPEKAEKPSKKDKDAKPDDYSVGIFHGGVAVMNGPLREQRYSWPKIVRIRYLRNMFIIARRPLEGEKSEQEITFKLDDIKQAKRLWKLAAEHHAFFRLREQQGPSRPVLAPRNFKAGRGGQDDLERQRSSSMEALEGSGGDWGTLPDVDRKRIRNKKDDSGLRGDESSVSQTQLGLNTNSLLNQSAFASDSNSSLNRRDKDRDSQADQDDKVVEAPLPPPPPPVVIEPVIPPLFGVDAALQDMMRDFLARTAASLGLNGGAGAGAGAGAVELERHERLTQQVPGSAPASAAQTNAAVGRRSPKELSGKRVAVALWQKQQFDPDVALDEAIAAALDLDLTAAVVSDSIADPKVTVHNREKQTRVVGTAI